MSRVEVRAKLMGSLVLGGRGETLCDVDIYTERIRHRAMVGANQPGDGFARITNDL